MTTSVLSLLRKGALAGSVVLHHLGGDHASFAVQVTRRLGLARRIPLGRGPIAWQVVAAHLADQPLAVGGAADQWAAGHPGAGLLDRLATSVVLHHGLDHLVPPRLMSGRMKALAALRRGSYQTALDELSERSRLARTTRSERLMMTPGVWPLLNGASSSSARPFHPRPRTVVHALTSSLPHTVSGYTARSHSLMTAQRELGWRVEAVTRVGYPAAIGKLLAADLDVIDGIPMHRLQPSWLPLTLAARLRAQAQGLAAVVEQVRPQVLHTTTDHTNAIAVQAVAHRFDLPWVYEMRGQLELTWLASRPDRLREPARTSERMALQRARETDAARTADAVVVLSQVQKHELIDRGVPADKITVAPNAVSPSLLSHHTTPAEARAHLGLPRQGHWVGTVSSLVDYEGLDTLLRAVARLRAEGRDIRCAIGGDGVSRPGLMALARELGINDQCLFPGRLARSAAVNWMAALDVVAVPRKDTPVCRVVTPLKPVEALALNRPVIASDLPALRELLEPTGNLLVTAEDDNAWARALTESIDDRAASTERAARGREWAAGRTWHSNAQLYADLYDSLR